MKKIIFLLTIIPQFSFGQNCIPTNKEMEQFQTQKFWTPIEIHEMDSPITLNGFKDLKNKFHFQAIHQRVQVKAKVEVDKNNSEFNNFFKYCKNGGSDAELLSSFRDLRNNRYKVSFRYLPKLEQFSNNPWKDQNYQETDTDLRLKISADSLSATQDSELDGYRQSLYTNLKAQLARQSQFGEITFDLSRMDDFVCDLIQGRASITLIKGASSKQALVSQEKQVEPLDLEWIYSGLKPYLQNTSSKEKQIFKASKWMSIQELERKTSVYSDEMGFNILSKLMRPDFSQLQQLNADQLTCAADQLQKYEQKYDVHNINIQVQMPSLKQIEDDNTKAIQ